MAGSAAGLGFYGGLLPLYGKLADAAQGLKSRLQYEQAYPEMTGGAQAPLGVPDPARIRQSIRNIIYGHSVRPAARSAISRPTSEPETRRPPPSLGRRTAIQRGVD